MSLIKEFQQFALKGNVVDMAVGVVIGTAFGKIVTSMVNDMIMPVVGSLTGGGSLGSKFAYLGTGERPVDLEAMRGSGEAYIAWGPFVQTTLDFLIIAVTIFIAIKLMNRIREQFEQEKEEEAKVAEPSAEVKLLTEIRDSLAK